VVQCAVCLPMLLEWQRQRERALAENWLRNHVCSHPFQAVIGRGSPWFGWIVT
jgi:hypothetical protein